MRWSTLPPLALAIALLFGAAAQGSNSTASIALGAVGFVVVGAWLALEIGTDMAERAHRIARRDYLEPEPPEAPPMPPGGRDSA